MQSRRHAYQLSGMWGNVMALVSNMCRNRGVSPRGASQGIARVGPVSDGASMARDGTAWYDEGESRWVCVSHSGAAFAGDAYQFQPSIGRRLK